MIVVASPPPLPQAKTLLHGDEILIPCPSQRAAGRIYDAMSINVRGPGAMMYLNFPSLLPASLFTRLGLGGPDDRAEPLSRYLKGPSGIAEMRAYEEAQAAERTAARLAEDELAAGLAAARERISRALREGAPSVLGVQSVVRLFF